MFKYAKNAFNSSTGSSDQTLEKMETGATADHSQDTISQVQKTLFFIWWAQFYLYMDNLI